MTDSPKQPILPVAKGLYLCDYVIGSESSKVDLYGLFNAIRPVKYPHVQKHFCVFAQLVGGLGNVPFFVDIRDARRDELIWTTETRLLSFPNRTTVVQMALSVEGCTFPQPAIYLIELLCDNTWVCDTNLLLR